MSETDSKFVTWVPQARNVAFRVRSGLGEFLLRGCPWEGGDIINDRWYGKKRNRPLHAPDASENSVGGGFSGPFVGESRDKCREGQAGRALLHGTFPVGRKRACRQGYGHNLEFKIQVPGSVLRVGDRNSPSGRDQCSCAGTGQFQPVVWTVRDSG